MTYADVRKKLADQRDMPAQQPDTPDAPEKLSARPPEHCLQRLLSIRERIAQGDALKAELKLAEEGDAQQEQQP